MKTRDNVDVHYLKFLIRNISQIIKRYKNQHTHWWGVLDPEHLKPNEFFKNLKEIEDQIENLTQDSRYYCKIFEQYCYLLKLLNQRANNTEIKNILIHELSNLDEAEWISEHIDIDTKIECALRNLSEAVSYESRVHQLFCKKWRVYGAMSDYSIWLELMDANIVKEALDNDYYHKIPILFGMCFGMNVLNQEQKFNVKEKIRLRNEIEIWSYSNLVKFFTEYMVEFAILHPDEDIEKKGRDIAHYVLPKLMMQVQKMRSYKYLKLETHDETIEIAKQLKVFYNEVKLSEPIGNVQRILAKSDVLKDSIYSTDVSGFINFIPNNQAKTHSNSHNFSQIALTPSFIQTKKTENFKRLRKALKGSGIALGVLIGMVAALTVIGGVTVITGGTDIVPLMAIASVLLSKLGIGGLIASGVSLVGITAGIGAVVADSRWEDKESMIQEVLISTAPMIDEKICKRLDEQDKKVFYSTFLKLHQQFGEEIKIAAADIDPSTKPLESSSEVKDNMESKDKIESSQNHTKEINLSERPTFSCRQK